MIGTKKTYDQYHKLFDAELLNSENILNQINNTREDLNKYLEKSILYSIVNEEISKNTTIQLTNRLNDITEYFLPYFIKADHLAIHYQSIYRKASLAIYFLAAFAVIIISAQYIFKLSHFLIIGEIIAMLAVIGIIGVGNYIGWHRRWLDYRFLAERLRTGIFLSFAVEEFTKNVTDRWPVNMVNESWNMEYFKDIWAGRPQPKAIPEASLSIIKHFIYHAWLDDQNKFHRNKSLKEYKFHKLISKIGEIFYGLTLIAAVLHFFHIGNDFMENVWTFFAIAFPTIGSAFSALRSHFEFKKTADRSRIVSLSLEYFMEQLVPITKIKDFYALLNNIDTLILQENIEWHATIASHKLETPA